MMLDLLLGWWQYDFMRRALFAVLLIMPLFSLLGTLVVNNGMAFFSDALGHSALAGVGIGVLLGLSDYSAVMVVFAVVFALAMNRIRHSRCLLYTSRFLLCPPAVRRGEGRGRGFAAAGCAAGRAPIPRWEARR